MPESRGHREAASNNAPASLLWARPGRPTCGFLILDHASAHAGFTEPGRRGRGERLPPGRHRSYKYKRSALQTVFEPRPLQLAISSLGARSPLPPGFIVPCLPTPAKQCKSGPAWVHEIKHDGYRLIARRTDDRVRLYPPHRMLVGDQPGCWGAAAGLPKKPEPRSSRHPGELSS